MINELLEANYLDAIGDDDVKLSHVTKAAEDLRDEIGKSPGLIVPLTLIALDPDTDSEDSLLVNTEGKLKKYWQTYSNKFRSKRPVQLLRGTVIEALSLLAAGNINFAAAIWFTGSTYLPYKDLKGEKDLLVGFLKSLGAKTEAAVVRQWAYSSDGKQLKQWIEGAIGEANGAQASFDGALAGAVGSLWSAETNTFDSKKAPSVATAVHSDIESAVAVAFDRLSKPLTNLTKLIATEVLKSKLLWWKETKYSETMATSYRICEDLLVAPAMAYELHLMMPELHPVSVEYFLSENVSDLLSDTPRSGVLDLADRTLKSLLSAQLPNDPLLPFVAADGRNSLVGLMNQARSAGKVTKADFKRNLNIDPATQLTFAEFAVWCFKDMQAIRLLNASGRRKK